MTIYIKYLKKGRREFGDYVWEAGGNSSVKVDAKTAADCITYRGGQFAADPEQSSLSKTDIKDLVRHLSVSEADVKGIFDSGDYEESSKIEDVLPENRVAQFADDYKISTVEALATVNDEQYQVLVNKSGAAKAEIDGWIAQAKELTGK